MCVVQSYQEVMIISCHCQICLNVVSGFYWLCLTSSVISETSN